MVVQLGAGFTTPQPPAPPTGDERRHTELLAELAAVREALWALAQQGTPQVHVPPPDLSEILYALDGMGVPNLPVEHVDPQQIGEAVANALDARRVEVPDRTGEVLEELKRIGRKFGVALANNAPVVSNDIASNPTRVLGTVEVTSQQKVEALLSTLRDTVLRRTDPLPPGENTIGHVKLDLLAETLLLLPSEARTTSGTSAAFDTSTKSRIAVDVNVSALSGVSPALRVFVDRLGADGLWYGVYTSNSVTTAGTVSTTIGQGMVVGQSLGSMCRLRWEITGTTPSATFSVSVVGK